MARFSSQSPSSAFIFRLGHVLHAATLDLSVSYPSLARSALSHRQPAKFPVTLSETPGTQRRLVLISGRANDVPLAGDDVPRIRESSAPEAAASSERTRRIRGRSANPRSPFFLQHPWFSFVLSPLHVELAFFVRRRSTTLLIPSPPTPIRETRGERRASRYACITIAEEFRRASVVQRSKYYSG